MCVMTCCAWHYSFLCDMDSVHVAWLVDLWRDSIIHMWMTYWHVTRLIKKKICGPHRIWKGVQLSLHTSIALYPHYCAHTGRSQNHYSVGDALICDVTHWCAIWFIDMWHDLLICDTTRWCVKWLVGVWHDSLMCDMTHRCVTWLIGVWHDLLMCDVTHWYVAWLIDVWHDSSIYDMPAPDNSRSITRRVAHQNVT